MSDGETPVWRFGVYELETRSGELRKHGIRLKLQEQPRQILILLLERPGEVVTREEIQKRLWSDGTFVDFDNAINTAVRKLRDALSDNAENPRFVETLARRGYRFVAPASLSTEPLPIPADVPVSSPVPVPEEMQVAPSAPAARHKYLWMAAIAAVVVAVVLVATRPASSVGKAADIRVRPLTSNPGAEVHPAFSSDGSRVAYAWNGGPDRKFAIYTKLVGAGDPVLLTRDLARDFSPAWSPDGQWVAAVRDLGPQSAIILIPAMGGRHRELTRVSKAPAGDANCVQSDFPHICGLDYWGRILSWSPDGKYLFTSGRAAPDSPHSIIRISAETGAQSAITFPPAGTSGDYGAVVSPDGNSLAFIRWAGAKTGDVYLASLVSGAAVEPRRITSARADLESLAWSGGGELIFSSDQAGRRELWRIEVARLGEPKRLEGAGENGTDLDVSPDGHRLAYTRAAYVGSLWKTPLDGLHAGPPVRITDSTARDKFSHISSDGKRIVFQSARSGVDEIWWCDQDGGHPTQLTNFGKGMTGSPRWSPDGQTIAFDSNVSGNWNVYLVGLSSGAPRRLTSGPQSSAVPSWSRDGEWIYFSSSRTGRLEVWKVRPDGTEEQQVTRNGGFIAAESPDGRSLYYTTRDNKLWKMPVHGGVPIEILPSVRGRAFTVTATGIYYAAANPGMELHFLDFATGAQQVIAPLSIYGHADVSQDERWALQPVPGIPEASLLLVENFH